MFSVINRVASLRAAAVLAIAAVWLIASFAVLFDANLRNDLHAFLLKYPGLAPVLLIVFQVVLASLVLPCSPLTVLAGLLWGFDAAILYSMIATITGSLWTFVLGRWVLKRWLPLERVSSPIAHGVLRQIEKLITRYTWRASAIAHANPALPGSSLGYAFGMTEVSLVSYAGGAVLGVLPLQVLLVGLGHALGQTLIIPTVHVVATLSGILLSLLLYRVCAARLDNRSNTRIIRNHE
jgi:uncharacterized membrane protein YdjX (TVP38/TMEM64 family)